MPHECASCGHEFPDGSKEMLSGCPECGGNKFQFIPGGEAATEEAGSSTDSSFDFDAETDDVETDSESGTGDDVIVADEEPIDDREDRAQASARSAVVSEDELPPSDLPPSGASKEHPEPTSTGPEEEARVPEDEGDASGDSADLSALREELNDQFESIKILQPGEYELNLMELYDREERIVALEEDGRYVIDVPSSWHEEDQE